MQTKLLEDMDIVQCDSSVTDDTISVHFHSVTRKKVTTTVNGRTQTVTTTKDVCLGDTVLDRVHMGDHCTLMSRN